MSTQIRGAQIRDLFAGDGLDWVTATGTNRNYLAVQVDGSSLEISGDALQVKALGITNAMISGAIADDKLAEDYIKTSEVDGTTIEFLGGSLNIVASGVTETELNPSVAGDGLAGGGGTPLSVNVDGTTIEIVTDTLQVISSGIDHGALSGLGDAEDHTWATTTDGLRPFTGTVSGVDPTEDAHLTTRQYVSTNFIDNTEMTTISGDILTYVSDNYIDNTEMTTISGDILTYVSDNYIDNTEMTTISGDILTYVSDNYIDNTEMTTISGDIIDYVDAVDHSIYSLTDGTRPFSGTVSGVTPTEDAHLTTKSYVDTQDTTISGDIITYVDAQDTALSGALETNIIWEVIDTPTVQIRPKAAHMGKAIYTSGDVTVGGDLTVTGTLFYTDTETVQISDNTLIINYGEVGAGVTGVTAGIEVDRGSETDYWFVFDERSDNFRIGVSGTQTSFNDYPLQPVATREDTPTDTRVAWWDAASYTFRTQGDTYITVNSGSDTIISAVNDITEVTIGTGGLTLKNSTADVNEILNVNEADAIDVSSTDDQLATAALIYQYINTVSGTVEHNELNGLQGGAANEYYHLDSTDYTVLSAITSTQVSNWDSAFGWGDHALVGYLTSFTETDPIWGASPSAGITTTDISQWDSAYTHSQIVTGNPHSLDLDDVTDGTSYERVAASQLESGIYIDATTAIKGIASFSSDNFAVTSGAVTIKDDGVSEPELAITNAPAASGVVLSWNGSAMQWIDIDVEVDAVTESDIRLENESASCDGGTTAFTLDVTPVDNSLQVFLNGLIQEKGGGKDYTHTGTTVTFIVAPLAGDILLIHYIAKD